MLTGIAIGLILWAIFSIIGVVSLRTWDNVSWSKALFVMLVIVSITGSLGYLLGKH